MTDRVALVTGGARGIGAAIVTRLKADGFFVVAADHDPAPTADRYVVGDVGDEQVVGAVLRGIGEHEGRLDAVICNAGINVRKPIGQLTLLEWQRVLETNLTSAFLLARGAETLLRAAGGSLVTIASTRAHMSEPHTESYAASKGGLLALTHALAVSLGPEVRVNCVSPGWIDTKSGELSAEDHAQHPAGRVGRPEDVAAIVSFLCGRESGFVTGAEFLVDGGMTRKMIYV